jgi:hypothetical protein
MAMTMPSNGSTEKSSRRKPGRPRKYGHGRINVTVRFTLETYIEIKAEAHRHGRSISEQVEYMVEQVRTQAEFIRIIGQLAANGLDSVAK